MASASEPHLPAAQRRAQLAQAIAQVRHTVEQACTRAQRAVESVNVIGVTKHKPASDVRLAYELGLRDFGENYVQELTAKQAELADLRDLRWHLIGHLQRNKVRHLAQAPVTLHTLDGEQLANEMIKRWSLVDHRAEVFVEVNLDNEVQKAGCLPEQVPALVHALSAHAELRVVGLMAIPPATSDPEQTRPYFRQLRQLAESLGLLRLSMGMSQDYAVAIEEGATEVRVGSAIFGAR